MKKTYLLILSSMLAAASFAQSTGRMVLNSAGGTIGTPGSIQMLISVGEPVVGMVETRDAGVSQGFLVASRSIVNTEETTGITEAPSEAATVYPNPFSTRVHVASLDDNIHIYVFNMVGQQVYSGDYEASGADLSGLAPGVYVLQAMSKDKTIINTKITKQ
ncbi:MAG: T9SS type A sorting domain-containing protein [Bacteroidetes bacterium]|nr:T9SS type A sorting domain-containing protein [Bacteroidota bacterium]